MKSYALKTEQGNANRTVASFLGLLLEKGVVDAILTPRATGARTSAVQALVKDPVDLAGAMPLVPLAMQNAARLVSSLTVQDPGQKIGAVLRSCETRALVELAKLHQANLEKLLIIGIDCPGTFEPVDYRKLAENGSFDPELWLAGAAKGDTAIGDTSIRVACTMCGHVTAEHANIHIGYIGCDPAKELLVQVQDNDELAEILPGLGLTETEPPASRDQIISEINTARDEEYRLQSAALMEKTGTLAGTANLLASCIRCYNCRQACPICFCQECVFIGPLFRHSPSDYLSWAQKKGSIEMPTDTTLFHLTRINHMGLSCVGCGHCQSACPVGLPLAVLFRSAGEKVQEIFGYTPGKDLEEELPLATYRVDELEPR